jgi:CRISPR-associated protein Cas2
MADRPMLTVYCYDIARPRTRARVASVLEDTAVRVQDSVFEVRLTRHAANRLYGRLVDLLDDGDLLRMYTISAAGLERCRAQGGAPIAEDGDFWIV